VSLPELAEATQREAVPAVPVPAEAPPLPSLGDPGSWSALGNQRAAAAAARVARSPAAAAPAAGTATPYAAEDAAIQLALASAGRQRVQRCGGGECHCGGACQGGDKDVPEEAQGAEPLDDPLSLRRP
jgi:hypothetical protein